MPPVTSRTKNLWMNNRTPKHAVALSEVRDPLDRLAPPQLFDYWDMLVTKYKPLGLRAYDTRLVALMMVHNVNTILTFNDAHFKYTEITVLNPFAVVGLPKS